MEASSSNALVKVRKVFTDEKTPLTLSMIREKTNLTTAAISMALCHLLKQRYVSRILVDNHTYKARKNVWLYEYYPDRISQEKAQLN